jgi:hypothetical protein
MDDLTKEPTAGMTPGAEEPAIGHVMDLSPQAGAVALLGGWVGPGGTWHRTAVVQEMTGREEDLLAGRGPVVPRFDAIMAGCLVSIGCETDRAICARAVTELHPADRAQLLLAIRKMTVGTFFDVRIACPSCKVLAPYAIDLRDVPTTALAGPGDQWIDVLPSGTAVQWHMMSGTDEAWLERVADAKGADAQQFTLALLARIEAVGDRTLDRVRDLPGAVAAVQGLRKRDRQALRDLIEVREPTIDLTIPFTCAGCGHAWQDTLPVATPGFFFPAATSRR